MGNTVHTYMRESSVQFAFQAQAQSLCLFVQGSTQTWAWADDEIYVTQTLAAM